jgi:hypothetical protein
VEIPSSIDEWGPEQVEDTPGNNTYANTYRLSEESDRIYNFHRSINFNPTITISEDNGDSWGESIHFIDTGAGGVRPYPRYCSNHEDRIDLIYTDGHPRDVANSIYHLYYEDGEFRVSDGSSVKDFADLPLNHDAGERGTVVYQYSDEPWSGRQGPDDYIPSARAWTWDIQYGKDGNPVCVFQAQRDNVTGNGWTHDRIYYYYARWNGDSWEKTFIAHAGRPLYSAERDYGGGMTIDPDNPNVVYFSSNAENPFNLDDLDQVPLKENDRYELYRGVTQDGGETFEWEQITENSPEDNLRPIVPEDHGYDRALVWFYGTYNSYTSFDTQVLAILKNKLEVKTSSLGKSGGSVSWQSSPGQTYRITGSTNLLTFPFIAASGITSQGPQTSSSFDVPEELTSSTRAFFRVEDE